MDKALQPNQHQEENIVNQNKDTPSSPYIQPFECAECGAYGERKIENAEPWQIKQAKNGRLPFKDETFGELCESCLDLREPTGCTVWEEVRCEICGVRERVTIENAPKQLVQEATPDGQIENSGIYHCNSCQEVERLWNAWEDAICIFPYCDMSDVANLLPNLKSEDKDEDTAHADRVTHAMHIVLEQCSHVVSRCLGVDDPLVEHFPRVSGVENIPPNPKKIGGIEGEATNCLGDVLVALQLLKKMILQKEKVPSEFK
ncbi:hypothetical protein C5Y96_19060 [Blastopirellula marina]|uniref:Uncharacterized protein n=1 Tax=Blastopirellula marina TaxID=124 RepID=A0A2S8F636_9BACT|nr:MULTISPECIES: hypothetical protein [Pirellulaceae]PQO27628.1 hypothetical protein C5Y96_19060 [Blastopirellula marina]RCS48166.1 hypothetical protein DTL36_19090 [Bremerella cremea]